MRRRPLAGRALPVVLAGLTAMAALAGCSAQAPLPSQLAPVRLVPAGTRVISQDEAATGRAAPSVCADGSDPVASLAPAGPAPAPTALPPGSTMARIAQRGVLVVGVDQNTYPFGYRDPATNTLAGFDVAVAKEMARAVLGDPERIRLRTESSTQRIPNLLSGDVDLVVQTMTVTCERRRQIEFSSVYYAAQQRVLVPKISPARQLSDLGNRPVCSIEGSTSVATLLAAPSRPTAVTVPEKNDCLVLLQQGQVDAISTDDTILGGFAAEDPRTDVRGPGLAAEPYGIGVAPRNTDLVRFVNAVLERMRTDGTWARIYAATPTLNATGGTTVVPPGPPVARYRG